MFHLTLITVFVILAIGFVVNVAQLVRAPDCGSGGRGFESHHSPHLCHQEIAQAVSLFTSIRWGVAKR
jgi:hypothetical protein